MPTRCWEVLGIRPTSDLAAIKEARRVLIRTWHPDIATTPEHQAHYTARCAEINAAYEDAVKFANIRARLLEQVADARRKRQTSQAEVWSTSGSLLSCIFMMLLPGENAR